MVSFQDRLQKHARAVDKSLAQALRDSMAQESGSEGCGTRSPDCCGTQRALSDLSDAMRHAVLAGGKRFRAFLVMESAALFDVPSRQSLFCATALEMLHGYSLVHDDLPAMDDSPLRRGQPTVHVLWDEATAILAGDGLLAESFALLAQENTHPDPAVRIELVGALAVAAGAAGMVGGQMIDLSESCATLGLAGITRLQTLKTGALMSFACQAGAILGRAPAPARAALTRYADSVGLAFQVADDLLDVMACPTDIGKPTGVDRDKPTFVECLGHDQAREKAVRLVAEAKAALDPFGGRGDMLCAAADFVLDRQV